AVEADLLAGRVEHVARAFAGHVDAERGRGPVEVHDADGEAAVEGDGVAGVDGGVDGAEGALLGGAHEVLRGGLAAARRLVAPLAEEVADGRAYLLIPRQRGVGVEAEEVGEPRRRRRCSERRGERGGEGADGESGV